jgi:tyrosine-protein kinase Etk/Wzc
MSSQVDAAGPTGPEEEEVSLLDLLIVLAKHKKLVIGFPFIAAVIAAGVSLVLPNRFTATARIVPPQQSSSGAAALLTQLGGALGSLAGAAGGALGIGGQNDVYIGMLKSRTVADNLIAKFDLKTVYDSEFQSLTRENLAGNTKITTGRDRIIMIEVDDKDPKRAADMANAYVEELVKLTSNLAITEASQRRLFFERQLKLAADNLVGAQVAARGALEKGGIVKVDEQGRAMLETGMRLRAQIAVKEVQLGAMRSFATDQNPELQRTQAEVDALRKELARLEGSSDPEKPSASAGSRMGIDNFKLIRDVRYYELLYELLARQYEVARLDEARDSSVIQVLDPADIPDRKSKPWRALIVVVTAVVTGFLAVLWAFFREATERAKNDPEQALRLESLRRHLRLR